jgi:thiol-disulfide isomerase/thioredoxin
MLAFRHFRTAAVVLSLFCSLSAQAAIPGAGDMAPDVLGKTLEGKPVKVGDYAGKVVVVSFWATWCAYCLKELPILEGVQKLGGAAQVQVIAVNTEERDVFRQVARHLKAMTLKLAYDPDEVGANAYGVKGIPHLVIIDRDGKIVAVYRGYSEASLDGIIASINLAIATPAKPN